MKRIIYSMYLVIKLVNAENWKPATDNNEILTKNVNISININEDNEIIKPEYYVVSQGHINPKRLRRHRLQKESQGLAISSPEDNKNTEQEEPWSDKIEELALQTPKNVAYMEEFIGPKTTTENTTTIENTNWKYQGDRPSEESDESKSTLIDYPFSVSIQRKGSHYATGALVNKRWIISTAGEFFNVRESLKLYRVRLGSVDCKSGGVVIPLKKIEIHPYYLYKKPNFDVALLRLAKNVEFTSFIRPIVISNIKGTVISAKFMTSYWPRVVFKGQILPVTAMERVLHNSMRVSTQRVIPYTSCVEIIKSIDEVLNESSLCLKPIAAHHSLCMPDAGAPIIADDGLWGVTSGWTSPLCPEYPVPTIFTRLSSESVRSWLDIHLLSS